MKYLTTIAALTLCAVTLPSYAVNSELTLGRSIVTDESSSANNYSRADSEITSLAFDVYFGDIDLSNPIGEQSFLSKQNTLSGRYRIFDDEGDEQNTYLRQFSYTHIVQDRFIVGVGYDSLLETRSLEAGYYLSDNLAASLTYSKTDEDFFDDSNYSILGLNVHAVIDLMGSNWLAIDTNVAQFDFKGIENHRVIDLTLSYYFNSRFSLSAGYGNSNAFIDDNPTLYFGEGRFYNFTGTYYLNDNVGLSLGIRNASRKEIDEIFLGGNERVLFQEKSRQVTTSVSVRF